MKNDSLLFNTENYSFKLGTHRGKQVIWIQFPYDRKLIKQLKKYIKTTWSRTASCWYVPDNKFYKNLFNIPVSYYSIKSLIQIYPTNQEELKRYTDELQLRGYSENTIRVYTNEFIQLLKILKTVNVKNLDPAKIRSYLRATNKLFCYL